ncbi:ABC transporter ATP-binding protein [Accumulibacter sp.]|uniref:ABC transporter ATP-binding protein n=1 Tax=Accumulibacter sp. TaxID=2053492 RepID=UPI0025D88A97|nr:ABC transporter ATP-binding protein [Accumulibacter sp.]MCM8596453.1 ABC transporter ATP-binding protein [Accumulibacter sp.]MCM8627375.1 ABC transporter ATP-binding protein [Accumulibacter sp.]MDS4050602.1 ABC transporter ATP-binding protein [Accumulibacter sp.]
MPDLAIDVSGINKHFGDRHVVRDLALQVCSGEIYGFLGPNGSGKTTSIRMLCGLLTPDSGRGSCLGFDVLRESAAIKREVGYMTQKFSLWDDLTIAENLDFVARMFGMAKRRQVVDRALDELGLGGRRDQLAGTLSGGWKQRLSLAACLLHEPRLLLLDEPTAGVDPMARRDFWEEIHRLSGGGMTVLVSTHYMDEAERCHRLAYLAYGSLLASGTAGEVVAGCRLHTWQVSGHGVADLAERLGRLPGADQVASFGTALHVAGQDGAMLEASMLALADESGLHVIPVAPSLEDAFIHLMGQARDPLGD